MENLIYWVWLSLCFVAGSDTPNKILSIYDSPKEFYDDYFNNPDLELEFLTKSDKNRIDKITLDKAKQILEKALKLKMKVYCQDDEIFPQRLKEIYGAPIVIYVYGDISGIDDEVAITIVGTRRLSNYGDRITKNIAYEIARAGGVVVSGCAVGADISALFGALKAGGRTVGVLACGLDIDYPKENHQIKMQMLKRGAIISEYPPSTPPHAHNFPVRNRLMSALSLGVLVTEAPAQSGSLITLRHAESQGKDVFCVPPYNIFDVSCCGVIKPLRDGAIPVFCANDVLIEYYASYPDKLNKAKVIETYMKLVKEERETPIKKVASNKTSYKKIPTKPPAPKSLSGVSLDIFNALDFEPISAETISINLNIPISQLYGILTQLEILGTITKYAGDRYGISK
jgi:DNA processing protein